MATSIKDLIASRFTTKLVSSFEHATPDGEFVSSCHTWWVVRFNMPHLMASSFQHATPDGEFVSTCHTWWCVRFNMPHLVLSLCQCTSSVYWQSLSACSDYTAPRGTVTGEYWMGEDVAGSGRGLIEYYCTIRLEGLRKVCQNNQ
jgi:hypothetical protein